MDWPKALGSLRPFFQATKGKSEPVVRVVVRRFEVDGLLEGHTRLGMLTMKVEMNAEEVAECGDYSAGEQAATRT